MRRSLLLTTIIVLVFFSCKKDGPAGPIDPALMGRWKMTAVKDDSTNTVMTKPPDVYVDAYITIAFTTATRGTLSGNLTQESVNGDFTIDGSKTFSIPLIKINYYFEFVGGSMDWDKAFDSNITLAQSYFLDPNGNLNITTRNSKVLTFTRN